MIDKKIFQEAFAPVRISEEIIEIVLKKAAKEQLCYNREKKENIDQADRRKQK